MRVRFSSAIRMDYLWVMNVCINCNNPIENKGKLYCGVKCKALFFQNRKRSEFRRETGLSYQTFRGVVRKLYFIDEIGGACSVCGYNKNLAALEFHHINPSDKEFNIDNRSLSNLSMQKLRGEVSKCALLCANCHKELHNKLLGIDGLKEILRGRLTVDHEAHILTV